MHGTANKLAKRETMTQKVIKMHQILTVPED